MFLWNESHTIWEKNPENNICPNESISLGMIKVIITGDARLKLQTAIHQGSKSPNLTTPSLGDLGQVTVPSSLHFPCLK